MTNLLNLDITIYPDNAAKGGKHIIMKEINLYHE